MMQTQTSSKTKVALLVGILLAAGGVAYLIGFVKVGFGNRAQLHIGPVSSQFPGYGYGYWYGYGYGYRPGVRR